MIKLKEGSKAPDFGLTDANGKTVRLSDFKGRKVVLYFYPKDMTPGCTIEACNFRDNFQEFKSNNIVILGISLDNELSHKKFAEKYNLPFTLLCDKDGKACRKYGVYGKKSMYGKTFYGINRSTFLIDKSGNILKIFPKVDVKVHSKEILNILK